MGLTLSALEGEEADEEEDHAPAKVLQAELPF